MGMYNVHLFFFDDLFQKEIGTGHLEQVSFVQGCLKMADARLCQLLFVHAAVGSNDDVIALFFQFLGKFHHMGLRPADLQPHQDHQNFIFLHATTPICSPMLVTFITGFAYFVTTFISEFTFSSTTPSTK